MERNDHSHTKKPHDQSSKVISLLSWFSRWISIPINRIKDVYSEEIAPYISTEKANDEHYKRDNDSLMRNIKNLTTTQPWANWTVEIIWIYHNKVLWNIVNIIDTIYPVELWEIIVTNKQRTLKLINHLKNQRLVKEEYINWFLYTRELYSRSHSSQFKSIIQLLWSLQVKLKEYDEW